jgi:hypothetical protein
VVEGGGEKPKGGKMVGGGGGGSAAVGKSLFLRKGGGLVKLENSEKLSRDLERSRLRSSKKLWFR